MLLQMLIVAIGLTLSMLFNRNNLNSLPTRDDQHLIDHVHKVDERDG